MPVGKSYYLVYCRDIVKKYQGTIDLVTYTARGVGNMPGTIYKNMFKVLRKKKKKPNEERGQTSSDDDEIEKK